MSTSLFLQFDRALMVFHQGSRRRAPLYAKVFEDGIKKSTVVINKSLSWLHHEAFRLETQKRITFPVDWKRFFFIYSYAKLQETLQLALLRQPKKPERGADPI